MATVATTQVIPADAQRRERWRNGAGWTREIVAAHAEGESGWDWRLSIAEIDADAPFSTFPGIDRELVLLSGNGLRLCFDDGERVVLKPPHDAARFAGERAVRGELVDGPTTDFNLMWRRDAIRARCWRRPLVGQVQVFVEPATTWAIHLLAGHAHFAPDTGLPPLTPGDTALLCSTDSRSRYALDGGGEALFIEIVPVAR